MPPREALEWSRANLVATETTCDAAAVEDPGNPVALPELSAVDHETESRLLGCLQVRPGGLDPKTPSRTREWLWRGLNSLPGQDSEENDQVEEPTELAPVASA